MTDSERLEQARIIGRNIAILLDENRMNQADLAKELGLSESAVGKWVRGEGAPRMGNVQRIADLFKVPVSAIVHDRNVAISSDKSFLLDRIESASAADLRKIRQIMELISDDEQHSR